ncbi:MAG: HNH endonuclease signature motif containing protein [Bacteroidota bacterium]|nr:HNH endonuclease signature motif containing protein [Bacteroidota bacterium]
MPTIKFSTRKAWEGEKEVSKGAFSEDTSFYHSTAWRKLTKAYRRAHPLCECAECQLRVVPLPSEHTDHIVPVKDGGEPLAWDNLQALNRVCHNRKSAKEKKK